MLAGGCGPDTMADFQQGRQTVVDRLKRRLNNYRNHNTVSNHHFEATVDAIYGDQHKQTLLLKQRHIESKVKKNTKKDNKKQDQSLLSAMGVSNGRIFFSYIKHSGGHGVLFKKFSFKEHSI